MAGFTTTLTAAPNEGGQAADGVVVKVIAAAAGAGDITEIAAAVAGSRYVILGGRLSCAGTETVEITSAATVIDTMQFIVASTLTFPSGLETVTAEALQLNKGATSAAQGWIRYKKVARGESVPEVYHESGK